jgi:putative heme-binding domain-containing protein
MIRSGFFLATLLTVLAVVAASDANAQHRKPWATSRLKGTPTTPPDFRVSRAFPRYSFERPTSIQEIPSTGELLLTQMNGLILTISKSDDSAEKHHVGELASLAGGDVNLFSAVLHPDFAKNGYLFVCLVHPEGGRHSRVSRYSTTRNATGQLMLVGDSEQVLIKWPSGGHNGGCLRFGPDGLLYISTGDGSGPNPPDGRTTGQDVTDLMGAVLRIDVDRRAGDTNYTIPTGNPFVNDKGARPEIYAYGLRNPWKFGVDSQTGELFVADNGWETWEMVHHVKNGQNCGWPVMEGRAELRTEVEVGPTPIVPPARDHHHSEANSVIGGPVYRSGILSGLNGYFVYGDYITGTIWGLKPDGDDYLYRDVVDTDLRIVDLAQGSNGELFVLDYDYTGGIYEILPNDVDDLSAEFPRLLSETGLFESTKELIPATGVVEYDVIVPCWQDGAAAKRWVAVPGLQSIGGDVGTDDSEYPDGTVLVKHLSIPSAAPVPLETQVLHYDNGAWNPYSYLWRDDGTDAELVTSIGSNKSVSWPDHNAPGLGGTRTWRAGATNECRLCHNAGSNFVLGFTSNQLQKTLGRGRNATTHQQALQRVGVLETSGAVDATAMLVDPHEADQDLNDRARSYLHTNCGVCHHRKGNAIVSFYLNRELSFADLKTNKGTGIGTFGMQNAKIITPGDPYRSVLMYRMSKLGYSRMPYIGSQAVDSQGVALIAEWIRSLSDDRSPETSSPLVAGSTAAKALSVLADDKDQTRRDAAVATLAASTEGSLALVTRLHAGQLTDKDRSAAITTASKADSNIRGLFDHFVPEAKRKKTLGRTFDPQLVLSREGDARRGKLIFFSSDARCRACHDVSDAARSVGPTLTDVAKKYLRRTELLQHIVKPSDKVDDKYATWVLVTTSGRVLTGLKQSESGDGVALRTADGKTVAVRNADIEEQQKSRTSLMPDGVLADLTAQEAADLVAFISSLSPEP